MLTSFHALYSGSLERLQVRTHSRWSSVKSSLSFTQSMNYRLRFSQPHLAKCLLSSEYLFSKSPMLDMHAVYRLASVLHATPACYQVDTNFDLTQGVSYVKAKSCVVALEFFPFLKFWAQKAHKFGNVDNPNIFQSRNVSFITILFSRKY